MRPKSMRYVITFFSTSDAMAVDKQCKAHGVPGRLIPVPTRITAGCGMAWSLPLDAKATFDSATRGVTPEGCFKLLI